MALECPTVPKTGATRLEQRRACPRARTGDARHDLERGDMPALLIPEHPHFEDDSERLVWDALRARLRDGDVLAVWRLDRLGRSLPHLIETIGALEARGVGFRSLTESIDTTTSGGRLIFHVFGALGQFERDLIRDRTKAGLTAAAARGRKGGRKPVVTAEKLQRAQEHIANGLNVREAATRLKVSKTALYAALQAVQATRT